MNPNKPSVKILLTKARNVKAESNQWLGNNQTGGQKNLCAVETGTIDQLETHRLTKYPLCIHQDDAMG